MGDLDKTINVILVKDEFTNEEFYEVTARVRMVNVSYHDYVPDKYIAGYMANELRKLVLTADEETLTELVRRTNGVHVCPCCKRPID